MVLCSRFAASFLIAAALAVAWSSPGRAEPASDGALQCTVICESYSATTQYTIAIQLPAEYSDLQAVTDYATQRRTDFTDWATEAPPRSFPYELRIDGATFASGSSTSGTQSLVLTIYSDTGVHPVTTYMSFTYDLATGTPITFDTLFAADAEPLEVLNPIVVRQLMDRGIHLPEPLGADDYRSFSITDTEITFYLDQDGTVPHEAGPRDVSIPRSELVPILA